MRKTILLIISALILTFPAYSQEVNGDTTTIDGKLILKVWGTHYERGYAQGYLLGAQIKDLFDDYIVNHCFQGSTMYYNIAYNLYTASFALEDKYAEEIEGMFDGMVEAGISLYNTTIGRDFTPIDGQMVNALGDLSGVMALDSRMGCSTLSAWGNATASDPELQGSLVVTRAFDWDMYQNLLNHHMITVNLPAEADEVPWVNFGFCGLIAPFSSISGDGVAAFQNVGNYGSPQPNPPPFHPMSFSLRNGIESADYNGDFAHNADDVIQAITDEVSLSSWILTITDDSSAQIVECNNSLGSVIRTERNNNIAPALPMNSLAATNHHRLLYDPIYCYRYSGIADSLVNSSEISVDRCWNVICSAAGVPNNVHLLEYAPALDLLKFSTAPNSSAPAFTQPPAEFVFSELLEPPVLVQSSEAIPDDFNFTVYPNPFNQRLALDFTLPAAGEIKLAVYDITGREVETLGTGGWERGRHRVVWNASGLASGVYFIRLMVDSRWSMVEKVALLK